jgi:hypothetical protein
LRRRDMVTRRESTFNLCLPVTLSPSPLVSKPVHGWIRSAHLVGAGQFSGANKMERLDTPYTQREVRRSDDLQVNDLPDGVGMWLT